MISSQTLKVKKKNKASLFVYIISLNVKCFLRLQRKKKSQTFQYNLKEGMCRNAFVSTFLVKHCTWQYFCKRREFYETYLLDRTAVTDNLFCCTLQ